MARKILALFLCGVLIGAAPGMGALSEAFAGSLKSSADQGAMGGADAPLINAFSINNFQSMSLPLGFEAAPAPGAVPDDLRNFEKRLRTINSSPEMRDKALTLYHRIEPYLADPKARPDEVRAAINRFNQRYGQKGYSRDLVLTELFDGLNNYATNMEAAGNYRTEISDGDDRLVRVANGMDGHIGVEYRTHKINSDLQRLEVYRPVNGRQELDQLGFSYEFNGVQKQKIVWSRKLVEAARELQQKLYYMPDIQARIDDAKTPEAEKKTLRAVLKASQDKYKKAGMGALLSRIQSSGPGRLAGRNLTPEEVDRLSRAIEDNQRALQAFAGERQLEQVQKAELGQLIQYFSQTLGLNYDPFKNKEGSGGAAGFASASVEDVQKILNDIDRGAYGGYGVLSRVFPGYRKVDPDRDMPPELKAATDEIVKYLNSAVVAQRRLKEARRRGLREQEAAFVEEMGRWTQLAQVELQQFGFLSDRVSLAHLLDGRNSMEIRLRAEDKGEAGRLINIATGQFGPKFHELSERTRVQAIEDAVGSFSVTLQNARYMNLYVFEMKDAVGALGARLRELRALFLSKEFAVFLKNPRSLEEFRKSREAGAYYGDKVNGKLYAFFLDRLPGAARRSLSQIDALIDAVDRVNADDPGAARGELGPVEDGWKAMLSLWGYSYSPDPEETQKNAQRLAVFRSNLFAAAEGFQTEMQMFSGFNTLDLLLEKTTMSKNLPETQPTRSWLARLGYYAGGAWLDPKLNVGGARDLAFRGSASVLNPEAYAMFGSKDQIQRRALIRDYLRRGNYERALTEMARIDPVNAQKALDRYRKYQKTEFEADGEDIENVLTRGPDRGKVVAALDVLESCFKAVPHYVRAGMAGFIAFDWAVMSVVSMGIGLAAAGLSYAVATGAKYFGETLESVRTLSTLARLAARVIEGVGRAFESVSKNIRAALAIPDAGIRALGSNFWRNMWRMWKLNAKNTLQTMGTVGTASGGIQVATHVLSPKTSSSESKMDAFKDGFLGGADWGAKTGWVFNMMPSADVWQGRNPVSQGFRVLGNVTGPVDLAGRAAARLPIISETTFGRVIKASAEESTVGQVVPEGFWGANSGLWSAASNRIQAMLSPWKLPLNMLTKTAMFVDGASKYMFMAEVATEGAQAASYGYRQSHLGDVLGKTPVVGRILKPEPLEKGGLAPSEHLQNLVRAHQDATGLAQVSFLMIPNSGIYSPEKIAESKKINAGVTALHEAGGKLLNDYMRAPVAGNKDFKVPIKWRHMPLKYLLGTREVEVPVNAETKARLYEMHFRSRGFKLPELLALESIPKVETEGAKGEKSERTNFQRFWSIDELRRFAGGENVTPSAKTEAELSGNGVVFLTDEAQAAAKKIVSEKLLRSVETRSLIARANSGDTLALDGISLKVSNEGSLKMLRERVQQAEFDLNAKRLDRGMMTALRGREAQLGFDPERVRENASETWKILIGAERSRGEENLARAMEEAREPMVDDLAFKYIADYAVRRRGKVRGDDKISKIVDLLVAADNKVLSYGHVLDQKGHPILSLRSPEQDPKYLPQKEAVKALWFATLKGEDIGAYTKALRLFEFGQASVGKTLILKVAALPLLKVLAEARGREVWFVTSHDHLVRQFNDDWAAYSGGRPPDFKVTSEDTLGFEELQRVQRGESSLGSRFVFAFDEFDEATMKPQRSIGEKVGQISNGNPMLEVLLKSLQQVRTAMKPVQEAVDAEKMSLKDAAKIENIIVAGMAKKLAPELRRAYKEALNSPDEAVRKEARKVGSAIRDKFGRLSRLEPDGAGGVTLRGDPEKSYVGNLLDFALDDGMEGYLRGMGSDHVKFLSRSDPSLSIEINEETGEVTPIHYGKKIPTLSTEYRATAQLIALEKMRAQGKDLPSLKVDLPLSHLITFNFKQLMRRLMKAGTDVLAVSGTANLPLEEFMNKEGIGIVNKEGQTPRPDSTFVMAAGGDAEVLSPNSLEAVKLNAAEALKSIKVDLPKEMDYRDTDLLRLAAFMTRKGLQPDPAKPGDKSLVVAVVDSLREMNAVEHVLVENNVAREEEFVRAYPDYVQEMNEEYRLGLVLKKVNMTALKNGTAKVVFLVRGVGDRGTDLPLKAYKGKFTCLFFGSHQNPETGYRQAMARLGLGRVPEQERVGYFNLVSARSLLRPSEENIYPEEVSKFMAQIRKGETPKDLVDRDAAKTLSRIAASNPDPKFLEKLSDPSSPEFRAFETRLDVYRAMHLPLQELAQREASRSSGMVDVAERKPFMLQNLKKAAIPAALLGLGPVLHFAGGIGWLTASSISGAATYAYNLLNKKFSKAPAAAPAQAP